MKKIILLALVMVLSTSLSTATAGKKKNKKQAAEPVAECCMAEAQPVVLATAADSLSYAAGKVATQGLVSYLQQQLKVDTAYLADFVKGYEEAIAGLDNPQYVAHQAGFQIAQMASQRILPSMNADFEGGPASLSADFFHKGFAAALNNDDTTLADSVAQSYFETTRKNIKEQVTAAYKAENEAWLAENKTKEGVVTLPDGLQYKVITMGQGEKPQKEQTVKVKYEGKLIDGTVFDSSYKRNPQTSEFQCDKVIKGWTEALTMMPVGSTWELYIPQELAYGERQTGNIKPYSTLIFTVELIDIKSSDTTAKPAKPDVRSRFKPVPSSKNVKRK